MQRLLSDGFGVDVACVVRTAKQVRRAGSSRRGRRSPGEDHSPEAIAIEGAEAYVWTPDGVKAMTLSYAYLEKRFGVVATARNWNTIEKIVAKL